MKKEQPYKKLAITMDIDILEKLEAIANEKRMNRSAMIQLAVTEYIQAKEAFDAMGGIDTLAKFMKSKADQEGGE